MIQPSVNCLVLLRQLMLGALALARVRAGRSRPARMAMMAMTTSSSIRVKPSEVFGLFDLCIFTGWDLRLVCPLTLPRSADDGKLAPDRPESQRCCACRFAVGSRSRIHASMEQDLMPGRWSCEQYLCSTSAGNG